MREIHTRGRYVSDNRGARAKCQTRAFLKQIKSQQRPRGTRDAINTTVIPSAPCPDLARDGPSAEALPRLVFQSAYVTGDEERPRHVRGVARGHTARRGRSRGRASGLAAPKPGLRWSPERRLLSPPHLAGPTPSRGRQDWPQSTPRPTKGRPQLSLPPQSVRSP